MSERSWALEHPSKSGQPEDPRVQAALREYLERLDRNELVDQDAYLARHSAIAEQLRSFIEGDDQFRKFAAAAPDRQGAEDSTKSLAGGGQDTLFPRSKVQSAAEFLGPGLVPGLAEPFGRHRILRPLGKGAMGAVYLAED